MPVVDPYSPVSVSDFCTYLSLPLDTVDYVRAEQILSLAQDLCESVVSPLPVGAAAVVLDVATRAWSNPTNVQDTATGPFSVSYGRAGGAYSSVSGGLWLTRQNKSTLRRLAGSGGTFSVDAAPNAGRNLPPWDAGNSWPGSGDSSSGYGGF